MKIYIVHEVHDVGMMGYYTEFHGVFTDVKDAEKCCENKPRAIVSEMDVM